MQRESVDLEKLVKDFSFDGHIKLFNGFKQCIKDLNLSKIGKAKEIILTFQSIFKEQTEITLTGINNIGVKISDTLRKEEKLLLSDINEKLNEAKISMIAEFNKSLESVNDSKTKIEGLEVAA